MKLVPWRNNKAEFVHTSEQDHPLARLRDEMDHLFDRFVRTPFAGVFGPDHWGATEFGWDPKLDLAETDKQITLRVELPGVKPEQVSVETSDRLLTIRGEKTEEKEEKSGTFQHRECNYGSFIRTIELPASVNAEKINAKFKDGVLTVTADKLPNARKRKIAVRNA